MFLLGLTMANSVWRNDSTDGTIRVSLPKDSGHILVVASDGELFIVLPIGRSYLVDEAAGPFGQEVLDAIDTGFAKIRESRET